MTNEDAVVVHFALRPLHYLTGLETMLTALIIPVLLTRPRTCSISIAGQVITATPQRCTEICEVEKIQLCDPDPPIWPLAPPVLGRSQSKMKNPK